MAFNWLPLTEYSTKYKVSISTLRRRIKADEIKYSFEDGKYLILDESLSAHQGAGSTHRPSQELESHRPSQADTMPVTLVSAQIENDSKNDGKNRSKNHLLSLW
jgi:hypothetical protein